jgi:hypothetical protein
MVLLAAALLANASPPEPQSHPVGAAVQATVTIRIVSGVSLKLDSPINPGAPPSHDSEVHAPDGSSVPAKLIEFQ